MNAFYMELLALCLLSIERNNVLAVNFLVGTALQDPLEEENDLNVFSRILKINEHLINKNVGDQIIQFGDIAVSTSKNARICNNCRWHRSSDGNSYVPYTFGTDFSNKERITIHSAMMEYGILTCVKFVYRTNEAAYIDLISESGCWSIVGRGGKKQRLSLERPSCVQQGVIQHELMHALGINHEQSRSDRDGYVRIIEQNISPGNEINFAKMVTNNLGTPYDYTSVMHYGKFDFSRRNSGPTIQPIPDPDVDIGQRHGFSPLDVIKINKLQGCNICGALLVDPSGSFTSPNFPKSYPNKADCNWIIRSSRKQKILLEFIVYQIRTFANCLGDHITVYNGGNPLQEVLLGPDCGAENPIVLANKNKMLIEFRSTWNSRAPGFKAKYKFVKCGYMFKMKKENIKFKTRRQAYYDEQCVWVLLVPRAHKIILQFTKMDIPQSEKCQNAYVSILDGSRTPPVLAGSFCGNLENPIEFSSSGRAVLLEYFHKKTWLQSNFQFSYRTIVNPTPFRITSHSSERFQTTSVLLICILLMYL